MTEQHPIGNKIVAGVATGIILAVLGKLWPPATRFLRWLWAILSTAVSVPLWSLLLVVVAVAVFVLAVRRARRSMASDQPGNTTSSSPKTSSAALADRLSGE